MSGKMTFEAGETMYFDPDELQKGNLVQITKETAELKVQLRHGENKVFVVTDVDLDKKTVTVKQSGVITSGAKSFFLSARPALRPLCKTSRLGQRLQGLKFRRRLPW